MTTATPSTINIIDREPAKYSEQHKTNLDRTKELYPEDKPLITLSSNVMYVNYYHD